MRSLFSKSSPESLPCPSQATWPWVGLRVRRGRLERAPPAPKYCGKRQGSRPAAGYQCLESTSSGRRLSFLRLS